MFKILQPKFKWIELKIEVKTEVRNSFKKKKVELVTKKIICQNDLIILKGQG